MSTPINPAPKTDQQNEARHSWSVRVAVVSGIPIRLHFTFLLLLAFIAISGYGGTGLVQAGFLIAVFFCVVLHELGHSLVAQRLGYGVRDIVLYPIGGVASIEETPRARHELLIAVAGPLVNVVIVGLLATYMQFFTGETAIERISGLIRGGGIASAGTHYLTMLLYSNIMLVVFNMIPAFPMDGGRVLRAALALKIGRVRATQIAAGIGQVVAVLLALTGFGVWGNPQNYFLVIIALFVYFAAGQERAAEQSRDVMSDAPISDAMMREYHTLAHGDTLKHAADVLLLGSQQDFPVVAGGDIVGMLSRSQLLRGLAREGDSAYVASFMDREVVFATPGEPLQDYLLSSHALRRAPVLIRETPESAVVGMVTLENAMEFLTLRQIARLRDDKDNGDFNGTRSDSGEKLV
ncbi:MAG: site-2 protease family protein [Armatimonadetes bacterium]|nr:site-2 protease family protein [Armatimonadota bacterium]